MPSRPPPETAELLERAGMGDDDARQRLLARHRDRLRRMVAVHLDRRLAARVDPSDLVQESLADAAEHLDDYLRDRPLPFYPWLRRLAQRQIIAARRRHLEARRRTVEREEDRVIAPADQSSVALADCLIAPGSSPSRHARHVEQRQRLREALAQLPDRDREVLVMKYLEQMTITELAAELDLTEAAAKKRHTRALLRLRAMWVDEPSEN